jgi:hypothetical protein
VGETEPQKPQHSLPVYNFATILYCPAVRQEMMPLSAEHAAFTGGMSQRKVPEVGCTDAIPGPLLPCVTASEDLYISRRTFEPAGAFLTAHTTSSLAPSVAVDVAVGLDTKSDATPALSLTSTVSVASRIPPPTVVQWRRKRVVEEIGGVVTVPLTLVLLAFWEVNVGRSGLEMTHDCIPEVTQPSWAVAEATTVFGFATNTIDGFPTCTVHCALAV